MQNTAPILLLSLCAALTGSRDAPAQFKVADGYGPDVAYNEAIERYFVVWEDTFSIKTDGVFGRYVRPNGTFPGSRFNIAPSGFIFIYAEEPRVAGVVGGNSDFAVVSLGGSAGHYPLFNAIANGRTSTSAAIAGLSDFHSSADVGGEATTADDDVIVVSHNQTQQAIQAYEVDVDTQTVARHLNLATGAGLGRVAIPASGGQIGRYLVTWNNNGDIYGAIVDRDLQVLVSEFAIAQSAAVEANAEVDGDGTNWVVAYEQQGGAGDNDIVCRGITYARGSAFVGPPVVVEGDPGQEEKDASVRWTGESYVIGFAEQYSGQDWDLYVKSVEFLGCLPCEGEFPWATRGALEQDLRIAAGPGRDGGLTVWERNNKIRGKLFSTDDGTVVDLGGGCGQAGTASATCATVGAPAFGMRTQSAAPRASGWLLLGVNHLNFACGPCTVVPDPIVALLTATDALGQAEVSFQLSSNPSQRGLSLAAQWMLVTPGGCSPMQLSLSNAIQVTIE